MSLWSKIKSLFSRPKPAPAAPPPSEFTLAFAIYANGQPVQGARVAVQVSGSAWLNGMTAADGYVPFQVPTSLTASHVNVDAEGFDPFNQHLELFGTNKQFDFTLKPSHFDPSTLSLAELARIRGAMWTARAPLPFGPRPYDPSNILALEYIYSYYTSGSPEIAEFALSEYKKRGYTHACIGPINAQSYRGHYPDIDFRQNFDAFLDWLEWLWDRGVMPIVFLGFDGQSLEDAKAVYDPLIRNNARAQRLMRIIVPHGWEPERYATSSWTWAEWGKWGHDLLPNALVLIHTMHDLDAPGGGDARGDDNGKGNDTVWQRVAPHFHGWLIQLGGYVFLKDSAGNEIFDHNHTEFRARLEDFKRNLRDYFIDANQRFRHGAKGWPTGSLWGPNTPIKLYLGEAAAFAAYMKNWPEEESLDFGDIAIAAGADGYLDGGRVDVP